MGDFRLQSDSGINSHRMIYTRIPGKAADKIEARTYTTRVPVTDQPKCRARPAHTPPIIPLRLSLVIPELISIPCSLDQPLSELNHFEILFPRTAVRANPKLRYILPTCTRCQAFFGATFFLFVYPATDDTHPDFIAFFRHVSDPVMAKTLVCHAKTRA